MSAEHSIDGRKCEAKFALPEGKVGSARTTRIFVARIPSSVSDAHFRAYFEQFGVCQDCYMPKDPSKQGHRGIGFVTYASPESGASALGVFACMGVFWPPGWLAQGWSRQLRRASCMQWCCSLRQCLAPDMPCKHAPAFSAACLLARAHCVC